MPKVKSNSLFTDIIFSKIFLIPGIIFMVLLVFGLVRSFTSNYAVDNEIKSLENQISELESENQKMTQFFNYLESDDFVAKEARMKLGLKKQGENLVVIKDQEVEKINQVNQENVLGEQVQTGNVISNIKRWFNYFFE